MTFDFFLNVFKSKGVQAIEIVKSPLVFGSNPEADIHFKVGVEKEPKDYFTISRENDKLWVNPLCTDFTLEVNGKEINTKTKLNHQDEILFNSKAKKPSKFTITQTRRIVREEPVAKHVKHERVADPMIKELEQKLRNLEESRQMDIDAIKEDRNRIFRELEQKRDENVKLQNEIDNGEETVSVLRNEMKKFSAERDQLKSEIQSGIKERDVLKESLKVYQTEIESILELSVETQKIIKAPKSSQEEENKLKQLEHQTTLDSLRNELILVPDRIKNGLETFLGKLVDKEKKKIQSIDDRLNDLSNSIQQGIHFVQQDPKLTQYKQQTPVLDASATDHDEDIL